MHLKISFLIFHNIQAGYIHWDLWYNCSVYDIPHIEIEYIIVCGQQEIFFVHLKELLKCTSCRLYHSFVVNLGLYTFTQMFILVSVLPHKFKLASDKWQHKHVLLCRKYFCRSCTVQFNSRRYNNARSTTKELISIEVTLGHPVYSGKFKMTTLRSIISLQNSFHESRLTKKLSVRRRTSIYSKALSASSPRTFKKSSHTNSIN
jgi:ribosomal protein L31